MAEAAQQPEGEAADVEHTALQGAAVELLTAQSECVIQTFTNRQTVDDPAQRFFFDEAARAFVSKSDPTQCVKYLADAGGFASWQCGSAPSFMAFDRREGKGHDRTAHAEYCVTLPGQGGGTACLKLATE